MDEGSAAVAARGLGRSIDRAPGPFAAALVTVTFMLMAGATIAASGPTLEPTPRPTPGPTTGPTLGAAPAPGSTPQSGLVAGSAPAQAAAPASIPDPGPPASGTSRPAGGPLASAAPGSAPRSLEDQLSAQLRTMIGSTDRAVIQYAVILGSRYRALQADATLTPAARRLGTLKILADVAVVNRPKTQALIKLSPDMWPRMVDDMRLVGLSDALDKGLEQIQKGKAAWLPFGAARIRRSDLARTLEELRDLVSTVKDPTAFAREVRERFDLYQSPGNYGTREVLVTVYAEPLIKGRKRAKAPYSVPLYADPHRARINPHSVTRERMRAGFLKGKKLEIAYVTDPLEAFSLGVEGSGTVQLVEGGYLRVSYIAHNGRHYRSLASLLVRDGRLVPWAADWDSVRAYFRRHPELLDRYLDQSPSVVFFKSEEVDGPRADERLTPGRSIAIDLSLFPRPGVFFVEGRLATVGPDGFATGFRPLGRFVLGQDTGGAIKGPGQIDLYLGATEEAYRISGHQREPGHLYLLLRKGARLD